MASDQIAKTRENKDRNVYVLYREKLRMPKLTKKQVDEVRLNLQAIARAVCEHVWGKKLY